MVTANKICMDCTVELCNKKLEIGMLVLDIRGHDVILGMIWLSAYCAVIDYRNQELIMRMPHLSSIYWGT